MDNRLLSAFIAPNRYELFGLKLRPFSARMLLNLHAIKSPFVTGGGAPSPEDVMMALKFCSGDYETIVDVKNFSLVEKIAIAKMHGDPMAYGAAATSFAGYMKEYMSSPVVVEMGKKKMDIITRDSRNLPDVMMIVTVLMAKMGMSEKDAWDLPLGKAMWYAASYAVLEGADLRFVTEEEENNADTDKEELKKHTEAMAKRLAEAMNEGKVKRMNIKTA